MTHVRIKIQDEKDKVKSPLFPELTLSDLKSIHISHDNEGANATDGELIDVGIIQNATAQGNAGIALKILLTDSNGKESYVVVQTTSSILHAIDSALKGAEQRWEAEHIKQN